MPKDHRLYGKFTLDFAENQKVLPLSDGAFRCLVEATLWSRKHETDGLLPTRLAIAKWSPEVLEELATNDPHKPSLVPVENGWLIHDYAEHQDTKAEIDARRERNKLNGQKGGLAKSKHVGKRVASKSVSENVAEEEEEKHSTTAKAVVEPRKRGTRITADWLPSEAAIAAMRDECPTVHLQAEHRKFVDYWTAKAGRDGVKLNWDATWRNWIRRAAENSSSRLTSASGSTVDDKVNGWLDLAKPQPHLKAIGE